MHNKVPFILFSVLLIILLSIPACNSGQNTTDTTEEEGQDLSPPLELPDKENPKLGSHLRELIRAEQRGEAEEFARQRGIRLANGDVKVIIECVPGQCNAVAVATTNAGAKQVEIHSQNDWVVAIVPITSLTILTDIPGVRLVRLPVQASDEKACIISRVINSSLG